jgi:hypothetical protein
MKCVARDEWRGEIARHAEEIEPWLSAHAQRRAEGRKHPVYDFLFEYYSHRPSRLREWSPGVNVLLEGARCGDVFANSAWCFVQRGAFVNGEALPRQRRESLLWVISLLEAIDGRTPFFGCHGLHEWAMVYESEEVRHADFPLRLSRGQIAEFMRSREVRCSHFDAFRFFTAAARPLNVLQPTAERRRELEQPGCVHVTIDNYKWATKFHPWVSSPTQRAALWLAVRARELDMRASPYDLRALGFEPICIETTSGREEYARQQRALAVEAAGVRRALLGELRAVAECWKAPMPSEAYASVD